MAALAIDHAWRKRFGQHDSRAQVDGDRPVDLLDLECCQAPGGGDAGVGDEHVDLTSFLREPFRLAHPRQVGTDYPRIAELISQLPEGVLGSRGEDKLCPGLAQASSDVRTEAGRRAGEQNSLPSEIFHARRIPTDVIPHFWPQPSAMRARIPHVWRQRSGTARRKEFES